MEINLEKKREIERLLRQEGGLPKRKALHIISIIVRALKEKAHEAGGASCSRTGAIQGQIQIARLP